MKEQTKLNLQKQLICTAIVIVFMLAANSLAFAQTSYRVGDKIEVEYSKTWYKAEIIEVQDGKYKIHYDGWGSVHDEWVTATRMRSIGGKAPMENRNNDADNKIQNQADENKKSSEENKATVKYKPGDRVECDKASIGVWEKGTVMHFLPNDNEKDSGKYYRVRTDFLKEKGMYLAGNVCFADYIRPLNESALKATGKYKVGDLVEATTYSSSAWVPAKIIAVEGAFYKVRYDGYESRYDEMIDDLRIRPIGGKQTEKVNKTETTPKPNGVTQLMPGTAWSLRLYRKSKGYSGDGTVQTMLFCPDGTWDTVRYGFGTAGGVGQRGTYKMAGKNLTLKNGQDGQTESYTITKLDAGTFELSDGSDIIWRLFNGVKADCK